MGCFLACFGSSKDGKRRKHVHNVQARDQRNSVQRSEGSTVSLAEDVSAKPINSVSETRDVKEEEEEQLSLSTRKMVTFDSNVRTYEHVSLGESQDFSLDKGENEEAGAVKRSEEVENLVEVKPRQSHYQSEDSSITSSSSRSYPPNHRYHSCRESDDELVDHEGSDVDDDDEDVDNLDDDDDSQDNGIVVDLRSKAVSTVEDEVTEVVNGLLPEREVRENRNARDRSVYVHPVLNPVENLTQWKAVKVKGTAPVKEKENLKLDQELQISFQSEPSFRELSFSFKEGKSGQFKKSTAQEMSVDASLSNWLGSSESARVKHRTVGSDNVGAPEKSMPSGLNSPGSFDDRPILGALTVEELKQFSAISSPRKSPSRSPDEMPIIGSVGTYWNNSASSKDSGSVSSYKGIPNTTSKYREDKRVNWHSTPFETRLERALNGGVNKAYSATHGSNVY